MEKVEDYFAYLMTLVKVYIGHASYIPRDGSRRSRSSLPTHHRIQVCVPTVLEIVN